jgi:hydrogenase 3 maturation protease
MRPEGRGARLRHEMGTWLKGSGVVVVAGIGNTLRRDDGVGPRIAADLHGTVPDDVATMECETAPESFVDDIVMLRPTHVLLIDAALIGLHPGEYRMAGVDEVLDISSVSTHAMPLRVFCDYITQLTGATVALLLIEPKDTDFGDNLSPEIERGRKEIACIMREMLSKKE